MRVRLKDIGKVVTGKTASTKDLSNFADEIPFITTVDLNNGFNLSQTERFISKKGFDSILSNTISGTSVIVNCIGSDMGNVGITNMTCATNQQINSIKEIRDFCNPYYLYYYLTLKKDYMRTIAGETAIPILSKSVFENIEIDLPDRTTQDKIAEILSGIDVQINRNDDIVKRLQVLGNTIYSQNAKLQTKTFNIENVCKPIWGNCPAGDNILNQCLENTIPYASGAGDIDDKTSVNPKAFTNKPTRIIHKNDICISVAGTVGKIAVATEDICIGRAMLSFTNPELYGYIYFGLNSYASALQKKATGAIQKITNSEHLSIVNLPTYTS